MKDKGQVISLVAMWAAVSRDWKFIKEGTDLQDIMNWFDSVHSKGVNYLMEMTSG